MSDYLLQRVHIDVRLYIISKVYNLTQPPPHNNFVLTPFFSNSCSSDVKSSRNVGRFEGSKFQHELII